jgi:type VI secretion system protein ImpH
MTGAQRRQASWLRKAAQSPWHHELFALLRRIDAAAAGQPRIGDARMPRHERVRLGQQPSLAFAPREIASIGARAGRVLLQVFGLGTLGPNGALPLHYTELVRARLHAMRDGASRDFLDLFHHRAFTLLYRAWAQAQAAAGLDRRGDESFTRHVASLVGDAACQPAAPWPAHARWASAAQRMRRTRSPRGLCAALQDYFRVPVGIEEFVLQWLDIDAAERCRLGVDDRGCRLGDAAVLGERIPDRQGRFRIVLGPLSLSQYLGFLPSASGGEAFAALHACVRCFVGLDHAWDLELQLHAAQAPCAALGRPATLARCAWLGDARAGADVGATVRVVFDVEAYDAGRR